MERTIRLPDDLLALIEGTAAQRGKSLDQWLEETLRAHIEDRSWRDLFEYGRKTGLESGYTEADVPDLVKEWRREQRGQVKSATLDSNIYVSAFEFGGLGARFIGMARAIRKIRRTPPSRLVQCL